MERYEVLMKVCGANDRSTSFMLEQECPPIQPESGTKLFVHHERPLPSLAAPRTIGTHP